MADWMDVKKAERRVKMRAEKLVVQRGLWMAV
jgi:hypothetical protein